MEIFKNSGFDGQTKDIFLSGVFSGGAGCVAVSCWSKVHCVINLTVRFLLARQILMRTAPACIHGNSYIQAFVFEPCSQRLLCGHILVKKISVHKNIWLHVARALGRGITIHFKIGNEIKTIHA